MVDLGKAANGKRNIIRAKFLVCFFVVTSGCVSVGKVDDPCAMANRDVSFQVLMENSIKNIYNMCLEHMRQDVIAEWGEQ